MHIQCRLMWQLCLTQHDNFVVNGGYAGSVVLNFVQVAQSELDIDTVKVILGEYRINSADVTLRHDATAEELIDVIEGNRVYIPCIYVLNKIDQISIEVCSFWQCFYWN